MILTMLILVTNLLLRRSVIESVLFALAIAVGITPQLLPAVVSTSLATGSRRLARLNVLVKRLVCIEDLGNIDILITDKTGTLTEGRISLLDAVDPTGAHDDAVLRVSLLATDVDAASAVSAPTRWMPQCWSPGRRALDDSHCPPSRHTAVRSCPPRDIGTARRGRPPISGGQGAAEQVMAKCAVVPDTAGQTLAALFTSGRRVVAVASKPAPELAVLTADDECDLVLDSFLVCANNEGGGAGFPGTTGGTGHRAQGGKGWTS